MPFFRKKILAGQADTFCDTFCKHHHNGNAGTLKHEMRKAVVDIDNASDGDIASGF